MLLLVESKRTDVAVRHMPRVIFTGQLLQMFSVFQCHYITLRYITLRYVTLRYITLSYITLHYITLSSINAVYFARSGV